MKHKKVLLISCIGMLVGFGILAHAQSSYAEPPTDHLKCYAIKDSVRVRRTIVNLFTSRFPDYAENCMIVLHR